MPETQSNPPVFRVGHGYDLHRLQSGGQLVLAGVVVASDLSPVAHSDGDVVLHAVVDAILGALGQGDIGELFPNDDPHWKNAASRVFVEAAMERARAAGFGVANLDVTILAERPKLKPFKAAMVASLAGMTGGVVNIKAGTNEGCDAIGRGEAVAAHAVVLLTVDALQSEIRPASVGGETIGDLSSLVGISLDQAEKELINNTLKMVNGNREQAAEILGIGERTLYRKIKEYNLTT